MDTTKWLIKTLPELTLQELAWAHLGESGHYRLKDSELVSVLPAIMGEIRQVSLLAGTQNFIPVTGMFAVLDQIGYAYSSDLKTVYPHDNASGIKKALYYFTSGTVSDNEIKTLYALRNGFIHNAGMVSQDKRGTGPDKANYVFRFDRESENLITPAAVHWDGDFQSLDPDKSVTIINPKKLLVLTEQVLNNARSAIISGSLIIKPDVTKEELYYRYLKCFRSSAK